MQFLQPGHFFGETNRKIQLGDITLTDTEYTLDFVDWHYHVNAYFTFILEGAVIEGNSKERYECSSGTLLFHSWQDPHYNIKPKGFTRGFHAEIASSWFAEYAVAHPEGAVKIRESEIKLLFHQLVKESYMPSELAVSGILMQVFGQLADTTKHPVEKNPSWLGKAREVLAENNASLLTLSEMAGVLDLHPVHLSRAFPKHFRCGFGEYIRKMKVEKALSLMHNSKRSLTDISFDCGFADQSHFIRCFKEITGLTPMRYRKLVIAN